MKQSVFKRSRGFSLIEVVTAISVMSVGVLPLIALLPVALGNSRANVDLTRGAQLARMIVSTLTSESFTSADALATVSEGQGNSGPSTAPLDLSRAPDPNNPLTPVCFFASYDSRRAPTVMRATAPAQSSQKNWVPSSMAADLDIYRVEMLVRPVPAVPGTSSTGSASTASVSAGSASSATTSGSVAGSVLTISVYPARTTANPVFTSQSYIANLHQIGTLTTQTNP